MGGARGVGPAAGGTAVQEGDRVGKACGTEIAWRGIAQEQQSWQDAIVGSGGESGRSPGCSTSGTVRPPGRSRRRSTACSSRAVTSPRFEAALVLRAGLRAGTVARKGRTSTGARQGTTTHLIPFAWEELEEDTIGMLRQERVCASRWSCSRPWASPSLRCSSPLSALHSRFRSPALRRAPRAVPTAMPRWARVPSPKQPPLLRARRSRAHRRAVPTPLHTDRSTAPFRPGRATGWARRLGASAPASPPRLSGAHARRSGRRRPLPSFGALADRRAARAAARRDNS